MTIEIHGSLEKIRELREVIESEFVDISFLETVRGSLLVRSYDHDAALKDAIKWFCLGAGLSVR